jgi:hypothetical protein
VVTVTPAGTTSTASFAGTAGQRVSLNFTGVTISSSKVSILKPGATNLRTPFTVTRAGRFLDVQTLPTTGTYKIVVDPRYSYTGRMTLRLYNVLADPTAPVTVGGAPVTVTTTTPGQNATLTFSGTEGQRVSANLTDVDYASGKLRIFSPDTTQLFSPALGFGRAGNFLEPKTLPATGAYTIQLDPQLLAIGSATVQLYAVPANPSSAITACTSLPCAATTATTTAPGQNAGLTFSGTAGQRISVLAGNSFYGLPLKLSVLKPDLTPLFSPAITVGDFDGFVETKTLDVAGTYTILVDPQAGDIGSLDVQLYTVPADGSGAITPGTPLTATTTMPGQNALYTFSGTANQRVSVNLTNVTYGSARVSILKPDMSQLAPPLFVPNTLGDFLEPVKLPVNGTYRVKVDPQGPSTGSLDVKLYIVPPDVTGALVANVAKNVQLPTPGENAVLTYSGTSGQRIFIDVSNVTVESARLKVTRPDGSSLQTSKPFNTTGTYVETKTLNQNGTYKVWIDPVDESTGSLDVTLFLVPADVGGSLANGVAKVVTTTAPGQNATPTFSATNGQRVFLKISSVSLTGEASPSVRVKILKPDGLSFASIFNAVTGDDYVGTKTVLLSGNYKVVIDPQGRTTGSVTLTYYVVPPDLTGVLGSSATLNFTTPGLKATYTFNGTAGDTVTIGESAGSSVDIARVGLKSPSGVELDNGTWDGAGGGSFTILSLPATGTYTVEVDPEGPYFGSLTLTKS